MKFKFFALHTLRILHSGHRIKLEACTNGHVILVTLNVFCDTTFICLRILFVNSECTVRAERRRVKNIIWSVGMHGQCLSQSSLTDVKQKWWLTNLLFKSQITFLIYGKMQTLFFITYMYVIRYATHAFYTFCNFFFLLATVTYSKSTVETLGAKTTWAGLCCFCRNSHNR